ncbi:unnamed protein product [Durusdinium trenchii]|uniref:SET domain-containing protein n=1 Tax=Durusdinium trenchii TaxID=1381693 RepID=A0ABP0QL07_9DINO
MDLEPWAAYGLELQDLGPKGRGLVAGKDFRCGEVLFREKGFRAKSPEHLALEVLASAEARAQVSHLHTGPLCHLEGETDDEKFSRAAMPEPCPTEFPRKYSKVRFNSFELNGCCFLPIMALFNHSCAPNAAITQLPPHEECHTAMVVVAEQGIARGTEIVYSYNSDCLFVPLRERRKRLLSNWGFLCKCSRCQVEEEAGLEDDEEEPPEMPQLLSWEEVDLKNVNLFQARHEVLHHPGIPFSERKQIFSAQLAAAVQLAPYLHPSLGTIYEELHDLCEASKPHTHAEKVAKFFSELGETGNALWPPTGK